jgi:hypothetical protein
MLDTQTPPVAVGTSAPSRAAVDAWTGDLAAVMDVPDDAAQPSDDEDETPQHEGN